MSPPSEGKGGKSDVSWPSNDGRAPRDSTIWTKRLPGVGVSTSESRNEGLGVGRICRACGRRMEEQNMIFLPGGRNFGGDGWKRGHQKNVCVEVRGRKVMGRGEKETLAEVAWLSV